MSSPLYFEVSDRVREASSLYSRLVLVVGPAQSGKTAVLRELQHDRGWPLVNVSLEMASRLRDLTTKLRPLRAGELFDELVREQSSEVVLLDNIGLLFLPELRAQPYLLLETVSRNRTVVATWSGVYSDATLTYASSDHPEFQRIDRPGALIVSSSRANRPTGRAAAQEPQI